MSSTGPIVGSFQIAHAYGLTPMTRRAPTNPHAPTTLNATGAAERAAKPGSRLVAGAVAGRVNFSGAEPSQDRSALAMYAHPADKNAAATAVSAGRLIDVSA
jgi:hypothetical protein